MTVELRNARHLFDASRLIFVMYTSMYVNVKWVFAIDIDGDWCDNLQ